MSSLLLRWCIIGLLLLHVDRRRCSRTTRSGAAATNCASTCLHGGRPLITAATHVGTLPVRWRVRRRRLMNFHARFGTRPLANATRRRIVIVIRLVAKKKGHDVCTVFLCCQFLCCCILLVSQDLYYNLRKRPLWFVLILLMRLPQRAHCRRPCPRHRPVQANWPCRRSC